MTDEKVEVSEPKKVSQFRLWLKRIGMAAGILVGLLILIHRPLFFHGTRYFAIRIAKQQNLEIDYQMSGTIFTRLVLTELTATPTGPGPIEVLSIERLALDYSLPGFIRQGLPGLLERLELINARIELTPGEPTEKTKGPRQAFKFPAIFPGEMRIENLNLVSHGPEGDLVIQDLDFILDPQHPGRFSVGKLSIPRFRTWEKIEATTTYRQRNLRIENLRLDESVEIGLLNLDASKLSESVLDIHLNAYAFGGSFAVDASIHDINVSNQTKLEARILGLPLERATEYFKIDTPVSGQLRQAHIGFDGPLEKPKEWNAQVDLDLINPVFKDTTLEQVALQANIEEGVADLPLQVTIDPANQLTILAEAILPDQLDELSRSDVTGTVSLHLDSLATLPVSALPIQSGSAQLQAPFRLQDGTLKAKVKGELSNFEGFNVTLANAAITLTVEKPVVADETRPAPTSPFEGLVYQGQLQASEAVASGYRAEKLEATFSGQGRKLTLDALDLSTGQNHITASGNYLIPQAGDNPKEMPMQIKADISAPVQEEFAAGPETDLRGELEAQIDLSHDLGWSGTIQAKSEGLQYKNVSLRHLDVNGVINDNVAKFERLNARFDDENYVEGRATVGLKKPYVYDADLDVNLNDLSKFQSLLPARDGERPPLGGSVKFNWKGEGSLADLQNQGDLQLSVQNATFGETRDIDATLNGTLSPDRISIPALTFSSSLGSLRTDLLIEEKSLHLTNLQLTIPGKAEISGSATLPFDLANAGNVARLIPADGPLKLNLSGRNIRLGPLLAKEDKVPPVSGRLDLTVTAEGTLARPNLRLDLQATELKFAAASDLAPARLNVAVELPVDQLNMNATFNLQGLAPLTVEAAYPLSLPEVLAQKKINLNAPVEARINLPSSRLEFLARLSNQIRRADGSIAIDARLTGTIQDPNVSGAARLNLASLRLSDQKIPPVSDFIAEINFTQDQIRLERFAGALAGGPFSLTGQIGLQPLNNPSIDLRLEAQNALLSRNETVTVRANADISVAGTLESSTVTGTVALTNSRFFREIDILPLQLPGRPAPKPPDRGDTTVTLPPFLADWIFDLKIVTADPFLIRGNLAAGSVNLDVKFAGTGANPVLDGYAYLQDFVASLPFSRLEIVSGYAYFTPDNPFVPILDLYGTSDIRNYTINVYIYGEATNPETVFSSEPPLPQEDIISLLATGTTTEELTGDSSVAAGRAAALLFQKLSRTIFKNREPPPPGSFLDRFDLNVGSVDPRTGNQEVQAEYRLTDHFLLIGDLDVQGQLSGQVKYLIRFR